MNLSTKKIDVYLEIGKKRTFACALDWPGWARSGRDEASALQALCDYAVRYERVLKDTQLDFKIPADSSALNVVERLEGNATTDFGAPDIAPTSDENAVDEFELHRLQAILHACWQAFGSTVQTATGKELRKGPRGGGRELEKIVNHLLDSEASYLGRIGGKLKLNAELNLSERLNLTLQVAQQALADMAQGKVSTQGPRGGARWTARYYVRRSAWHVLDHVWEIEDRVMAG